MSNPQLSATLEALRAQRASAEKRVANARHELRDAEIALTRLTGAIDSLELLLSPTYEVGTPGGDPDDDTGDKPSSATDAQALTPSGNQTDVPRGESAAPYIPPPAIAPYASQSGGKRLKSKLMVADLLKRIGEPVSRPRLVSEFFNYYGLEDLKEYWARPDNALNTAIDRSREEGLIRAFKDPIGGHAIYEAAKDQKPPDRIVQNGDLWGG